VVYRRLGWPQKGRNEKEKGPGAGPLLLVGDGLGRPPVGADSGGTSVWDEGPSAPFGLWYVLETLTRLFTAHGPPAYIRSDNGPELTARVVRDWLQDLGVQTLFIEPGSPWENGYCSYCTSWG